MGLIPRTRTLTITVSQALYDDYQHLRRRAKRVGCDLDVEQQFAAMLAPLLKNTEKEIEPREAAKKQAEERRRAEAAHRKAQQHQVPAAPIVKAVPPQQKS